MMDEVICKICGLKAKNKCGLCAHINRTHKITTKQYFDEFIEPFEHKCPYCNNERKFGPSGFYLETCCSNECKQKLSIHNIQKVKNTNREKFGTDWAMQNLQIHEKWQKTVTEKYGIHNISELESVKKKKKNTLFEHYGDPNYQNLELQRETRIKRYGEDAKFFANLEKAKKTILKKYGNECITKTDYFKKKARETCLKRYGVENPAQSNELTKKKKHRYTFDNEKFDSKAEICVFIFCKENGLKVKTHPTKIKYIDSAGREHFYLPDFEIEGRLYEVKADFYLNENNELINPYKNSGTEESNILLAEKLKAKTQCMKDNHVTIIRTSQLNELDKIIFK